MIRQLQVRNFKSWKDTGLMQIAPLTGLFGANSSGKTSILQMLLMLKQTIESADRGRVLHMGDDRSLVDLGTYFDMIHGHGVGEVLSLFLHWDLPRPLKISNPRDQGKTLYEIPELTFEVDIKGDTAGPAVESLKYSFGDNHFGMKRVTGTNGKEEYKLISENYDALHSPGRSWPLPAPVKCYGFPNEVIAYYQNVGFLSNLVLALEDQFGRLAYLGPLREYPKRSYLWGGERPTSVGMRGELAVPALLSSRQKGPSISFGRGRKRQTIEERIAYWLQEMGLIHSYSLKPIAQNRKDYELRVKKTLTSPEVLITDVGFGVSQILPVMVLCYYVPEGSTILLEQPEIHLHPSVQASLADVLIEVVTRRNIQIIVESHSEHLLRRLQRRIAEGAMPSENTALYFCRMPNGSSVKEKLNVDSAGNITNWPDGFFGDVTSDLVAMTEAAMKKQSEANG
ncbi:MAG: DUF3696 domain-containing protein [Candidatus Brocadiia bacterium]